MNQDYIHYKNKSRVISIDAHQLKQQLLFRLMALMLTGILMTMFAKAQPVISSFSPSSGAVGSSVTITGTAFDATVANNIVYFGATQAMVTAASTTSLTVTVPSGATYQPITVINTVTGLIGYAAKPFNITYNSGKGQPITTASFNARVNFATGINPASIVAVADIDGDGKPDLITVDRLTKTFSVLRNTCTKGVINASSFSAKVDFVTDSTPSAVAIGDLDGDGKPDIVITNQFKNTVTVYKNNSTSGSITTASFAAPFSLLTDTLSLPTSVAIGDLDGDGKPELVIVNSFRNNVSVLKNISSTGSLSNASFSPAVNFTTGLGPNMVIVADLDGDGRADIATANFAAKSVSVLRNKTSNNVIDSTSFAAKSDFTVGTGPYSIAVADLNGDGKPELITANQSSNTISILTNTATSGTIGTGSFAAKVDILSNGESPYYVTVANVDGDSIPDLLVANLISNKLSIIKNNYVSGTLNAGSFSAAVELPTGYYPYSVSVADFDGDGKPDLAVPNFGNNNISVYQNLLSNVVPVKLISFIGRYENQGKALLEWTSASEINTISYTIERSNNGSDFSMIGKADAKGAGNYNFTDNKVAGTSILYYRLLITDKDGSISYSPIISIAINGNKEYHIYPNPARNFINIESNGKSTGIVILTDLNGRTILSTKLNGNNLQQLSLGTISKGIYSLSIITANGKQSEAVVVE